MWSKIAEEMQLPWRAVEAMHWQLGEADMARRAGVVPFSLSAVSIDTPPTHTQHQSQQLTPGPIPNAPRGHTYSQSLGSTNCLGPALPRYSRSHVLTPHMGQSDVNARTMAATRRDSIPRSMSHTNGMVSPREGLMLAGISSLNGSQPSRSQLLPSVAEMTTGVTMAAYSAPAYAVSTSAMVGMAHTIDRAGGSSGNGYSTTTLGHGYQPSMAAGINVQYSVEPLRMNGREFREESMAIAGNAGATWDRTDRGKRGSSPEARVRDVMHRG